MEEELKLLRAVVFYLLVEVEEAAVGVAFPAPEPPAEGGEVDGVLVVEALIEVDKFVDVQVVDDTEAVAARTFPRRVIEGEDVRVADEGPPDARKEQAQDRIDIRIGADRRTRVRRGLLLIDDDRHRQVGDALHLRTAVFGQILLYEAWEGLVELAPRFRGDRIETERRFAGAGDAGEYGDDLFGDLDGDVFEVVFKGVCYFDKFMCHSISSLHLLPAGLPLSATPHFAASAQSWAANS